MSFSFWPGLAALALLPAAALAQQGQAADPADAGAPVPPIDHVSAFTNYQGTADSALAPDQVWRTANQEVGNADAQAMPMAPHGAHQPVMPSPNPHAGHGAHHQTQGK